MWPPDSVGPAKRYAAQGRISQTLDDVKAMIHADPFSRENLIVGLDIQQWDPLFGQLSELSSLDVPAELKGGQH
ncbi:hypothetical protein [Lonsdalea iberica]|uniref:hypothetical protein n=1 Tax=Lonsdalea iberica TaxID=1082703 RepID=UPI001F0AD93D|nr:hypothetical protein [Lonsdalea iberica]